MAEEAFRRHVAQCSLGDRVLRDSSEPCRRAGSSGRVLRTIEKRIRWILVAAILGCDNGPVDPGRGAKITGEIVAVDGKPVSNLRVTLTAIVGGGSETKTAAVGSDGRFELEVPGTLTSTDVVSATIDAAPFTPRVFRPVLVNGPIDSVRAWLARPLLVPRAINITATGFGDTSRVVSLFAAFSPPCINLGNVNCDSFYPELWLSHVALWNEAQLPVPLAFDRVSSRGPITAADSTVLWSVVDRLHRDLGRVMFRPATLATGVRPDSAGYVSRTVVISVDSTLIGAGGETEWKWDANYDLVAAKMRVPRATAFASVTIVQHELMHALGFNHTCGWPSLMGGYNCTFASALTAGDAAAFALAYAVRRAVLARAPTTTLGDARRGETQIEGPSATVSR